MAFGGDTAESYYDEGLTASMKGDLEAAIEHLERAIQLDNTLAAAYHQLGKVHHRLGNQRKAIAFLRQVVQNRPQQIPARLDLAAALLASGETAEAQNIFTAVVKEKPNNGRAHLGLAQCAFEQARWDEALLEAQQSINLGGGSFGAYYLLGRAAKVLNRGDIMATAFERADAVIEKSIETSPDAPEGFYLRGELNFVKADYARALDQYRAAEDRAQPGKHYAAYGEHFDLNDILARRGMCLNQLGRPDAAQEIAQRILQQNPEHRGAKALLG